MTYDDICAVIVTRGDQPMTVERITRNLPYGQVEVWDNSTFFDQKVYGRYFAAEMRTERPFIYFQDDDVIFTAHEALVKAATETPDRIVTNMYDDWIESCEYFDLALVGLGSIVPNGLWGPVFKRYRSAYPDDDRFDLDADFIFGTLAPWRRLDFGHEILDIASDESRLWRQEGQFEGKWRSIHRARALRTVVLAMIVKNEEENLPNALDSAKGLFDRVVVVDTGSTDKTIEVFRNWCLDNDARGELFERPWVDYGTNRNELLDLARPRGDYILMMDADDTLEFPDGMRPGDWAWPELSADAYMLHYAGKLDYAQPRLIASRYPWYFDSTVHAALDHADDAATPTAGNLRVPLVMHHGWTRHGDEKVKRDIELLTEEIEAGNEVPRHLFLRAKAYEGLKLNDDAILDYEARLAYSSGDEEAFYSRFRLGVLLIEHRGLFAEGCDQLFQAYLDRPQRIESLRALAHFCTVMADATPYPEDDMIIVHRELYGVRNV